MCNPKGEMNLFGFINRYYTKIYVPWNVLILLYFFSVFQVNAAHLLDIEYVQQSFWHQVHFLNTTASLLNSKPLHHLQSKAIKRNLGQFFANYD